MKSGAEAKRDGSPMAGGQTGAGNGIQTAQRTEVPHQCEQRPSRDLCAQIAVNTISPLFGQTHRLDTLLQHDLLRRLSEALLGQPPSMRLRPSLAAVGIDPFVTQQKRS